MPNVRASFEGSVAALPLPQSSLVLTASQKNFIHDCLKIPKNFKKITKKCSKISQKFSKNSQKFLKNCSKNEKKILLTIVPKLFFSKLFSERPKLFWESKSDPLNRQISKFQDRHPSLRFSFKGKEVGENWTASFFLLNFPKKIEKFPTLLQKIFSLRNFIFEKKNKLCAVFEDLSNEHTFSSRGKKLRKFLPKSFFSQTIFGSCMVQKKLSNQKGTFWRL